jgi:hypothetical protein
MNTRENIRLLPIVSLLLAAIIFGVCGCQGKEKKVVPIMGKVTEGPTSTPIGNKAQPGKVTEKAPTPY